MSFILYQTRLNASLSEMLSVCVLSVCARSSCCELPRHKLTMARVLIHEEWRFPVRRLLYWLLQRMEV